MEKRETAADYKAMKRIWDHGGKAATHAWMKGRTFANLAAAFADWMQKNETVAMDMYAKG